MASIKLMYIYAKYADIMYKYTNVIGGINMKKIITMFLAFLMVSSVIAGCGSKPDSNSNSQTSTGVKVIDIQLTQEEYAFGVDKNQPELLEEVNKFIAEIQSNGTFEKILDKYFGDGTPEPVTSAELDSSKDQLVVATNAAFEPFEYMEGDKFYGIDMEIAKLLADHLGQELVISNMEFESVCLSVGQSKADIAMSGLTIKEDRKEYVNFTNKYYDAAQKLIVKADDSTFDNAKTKEDVEKILSELKSDTKIGVQTGTTGQFYVEGDDEWGFDGYDVECVGYKAGSLAVQDMINGNITYVIIDEAPANSITKAINELN